jgi:hypothetical protein
MMVWQLTDFLALGWRGWLQGVESQDRPLAMSWVDMCKWPLPTRCDPLARPHLNFCYSAILLKNSHK